MENKTESQLLSDEISLLDLWGIIYESKFFIVFFTIIFSLGSVFYSFSLPPVWKVNLMMISSEESQTNIQSSSNLGNLASLVGINLPQTSNKQQTALAILDSRIFLEDFLVKNNILKDLYKDDWDKNNEKWKIKSPEIWSAINLFKNLTSYRTDPDSGVINFSLEWEDPELAAQWANDLITSLNDFLRYEEIKNSESNIFFLEEQAKTVSISNLRLMLDGLILEEIKKITLAKTTKDYAFKVLDPAVIPLERHGPQKRLAVLFGTLIGFVMSITLVFLRRFLKNLREINS
tara:strand:- start:31787 stop:32656 length:870 start_codon:yes stop_codon:yes gene_type:complete